jgi:hypothetical protein
MDDARLNHLYETLNKLEKDAARLAYDADDANVDVYLEVVYLKGYIDAMRMEPPSKLQSLKSRA